jgi:hypothetical protein
MAARDPKTTAIQIRFLTNSVPARFNRCPDERMAITSFTRADTPHLVTLQK